MAVELYTCEASDWRFEAWESSDAQVTLPALGITLALANLYAKVEFEQ